MTRHKYNIKEMSKNKNLQTIWSCAWHLAYRLEPREWGIRKVTGDQKSTSAVPPPTQWTSAEVHVSGVQTMHQCCHEHCRQQCRPGYASENGKQGGNRLWWWTRENCDQIGFIAISLNQHVTCAISQCHSDSVPIGSMAVELGVEILQGLPMTMLVLPIVPWTFAWTSWRPQYILTPLTCHIASTWVLLSSTSRCDINNLLWINRKSQAGWSST